MPILTRYFTDVSGICSFAVIRVLTKLFGVTDARLANAWTYKLNEIDIRSHGIGIGVNQGGGFYPLEQLPRSALVKSVTEVRLLLFFFYFVSNGCLSVFVFRKLPCLRFNIWRMWYKLSNCFKGQISPKISIYFHFLNFKIISSVFIRLKKYTHLLNHTFIYILKLRFAIFKKIKKNVFISEAKINVPLNRKRKLNAVSDKS
jgi:hypothetical protein